MEIEMPAFDKAQYRIANGHSHRQANSYYCGIIALANMYGYIRQFDVKVMNQSKTKIFRMKVLCINYEQKKLARRRRRT